MQFAVGLRAVKNPANGLKLIDETLRRFPEISQTGMDVLWNCFVKFGDNSKRLRPRELAKECSLFIEKLPVSFADLLSGRNGAELVSLAGDGDVGICLICGSLSNDICQHHGSEKCPGTGWMVLTGRYATTTLLAKSDGSGKFGRDVPLYWSEEGFEDVGLRVGLSLVLSCERQQSLAGKISMINHGTADLIQD
jgi:hypothetical protein